MPPPSTTPPVSEPIEPKQSPAAGAMPEPEEETPVHRSARQGLTGSGMSGWCSIVAPSVMCSLPSSTAPAWSRRVTTVAS